MNKHSSLIRLRFRLIKKVLVHLGINPWSARMAHLAVCSPAVKSGKTAEAALLLKIKLRWSHKPVIVSLGSSSEWLKEGAVGCSRGNGTISTKRVFGGSGSSDGSRVPGGPDVSAIVGSLGSHWSSILAVVVLAESGLWLSRDTVVTVGHLLGASLIAIEVAMASSLLHIVARGTAAIAI